MIHYVLYLQVISNYHVAASLSFSKIDVSKKSEELSMNKNIFSKQGASTNTPHNIKRVKWKPILRGNRFENNEHMQRIESTSLVRSSDADKNDNFIEKTERNFYFQFVLAGDKDMDQLKECCVDQLKKGIFTTIYNLVNGMGTILLEGNTFFFNIVKLERKPIENSTIYTLHPYFNNYLILSTCLM